jgi:SSS family transporter
MAWIADRWFVLLLLAAYVGVMVHHALAGRRATRGVADYYVGGRSLGGLAIGISFFATYSSTNSFVGFAGQAYTYGVAWLLLAPMAVVFAALAWTVVAPRLRPFTAALGSLTMPDFFGFRFQSLSARVLAAVIVIFSSFFYLTAVFKGIGNTLEAFLAVPYWIAVLIVFVVVVTYTAVGGFHSVVKTDVVQGVMLVLAAVLLAGGVVLAAGGPGALGEVRALPGGDVLFTRDAGIAFPLLIGVMISGTSKLMIEPRQLSRFYALKDAASVRRGTWISVLCFLVVYSLLVPLGLYAHHLVPADAGITDTDRLIPGLLVDTAVFHPAVSGFILVSLLGAAMSSIDSVLLVMASTCQRDLAGLLRPPDSEASAIRATRVYVVLFAGITTAIALNPPGGIVTLTAFSGSLYVACFLAPMVLGLYWHRGSGAAVNAAMLTGLAVLLVWPVVDLWPGVHEVFPAAACSLLAYLGTAAMTPPVRSTTIDPFFARAEPPALADAPAR